VGQVERILLTGASGLLGSRLLPELRGKAEVASPGLSEFDLDRPETVRTSIGAFRPRIVVHLAADARVDHCEEHPDEARRTNVRGTVAVAESCRDLGARLVLMSTDYVFDGTKRQPYRESDPTGPLNVYGRTKEEAERAVAALVEDHLIVRSSSLFGRGGPSFVSAILDRARRGEALEVVDDQTQAPTYVGHLAPALARAVWSGMRGIVHIAAGGSCTWHGFARAILDVTGLDVPCAPISSERSGRPARRPAYSVLDCSVAADTLGIALPGWRDGMADHLAEIGARKR
jgi:dTDP-4-dehydrorhamnose reductase